MTPPETRAPQGTLIVVGTGIKLVSHVTQAAQQAIAQAEVVLFVAGDALLATWITRLNPAAESLHTLYAPGKRRRQTYREMTARILAEVRHGRHVCAAFYGHPGVFVRPAHAAIRQARREGFPAGMLPGISAEDCLFADLEIAPLPAGWQRYEATDFLQQQRRFDPASHLILWQIGVIGQRHFQANDETGRAGLHQLTQTLLESYPAGHEVIVYEAAIYPTLAPVIQRRPLAHLPQANVTPLSTLYVPPVAAPRPDPTMLRRLGLANP